MTAGQSFHPEFDAALDELAAEVDAAVLDIAVATGLPLDLALTAAQSHLVARLAAIVGAPAVVELLDDMAEWFDDQSPPGCTDLAFLKPAGTA